VKIRKKEDCAGEGHGVGCTRPQRDNDSVFRLLEPNETQISYRIRDELIVKCVTAYRIA